MTTQSTTEPLIASKPRRNTWLGVAGVAVTFATTKSRMATGNRVGAIAWEGGEHAGRVEVRHIKGDGRYPAEHRVFAEAVVADMAEAEAWATERFTIRTGDRVTRHEGREASMWQEGVVTAMGTCPGGDVLLMVAGDNGEEFRFYDRQAAKVTP